MEYSNAIFAGGAPGATTGTPTSFLDPSYEEWCSVQHSSVPLRPIQVPEAPVEDILDDFGLGSDNLDLDLGNDDELLDMLAREATSPNMGSDGAVPEMDTGIFDDSLSYSSLPSSDGSIAKKRSGADLSVAEIAVALMNNPEALELAKIVVAPQEAPIRTYKPTKCPPPLGSRVPATSKSTAGKRRAKRRAVPADEKDEKYWERRRRNTMAVRRNRLRKKLLSGGDPDVLERAEAQLAALISNESQLGSEDSFEL
eukprot:m.331379 g.331379  ORF g.331379 m.331379 type:complete len:255 (-) comp16714_c0_seq1:100-864(-)